MVTSHSRLVNFLFSTGDDCFSACSCSNPILDRCFPFLVWYFLISYIDYWNSLGDLDSRFVIYNSRSVVFQSRLLISDSRMVISTSRILISQSHRRNDYLSSTGTHYSIGTSTHFCHTRSISDTSPTREKIPYARAFYEVISISARCLVSGFFPLGWILIVWTNSIFPLDPKHYP